MSNETNITIDEARALVSDAALWPRVRDCLWDFASQIHPSWMEGLGRETGDGGQEDEPSVTSQVPRLMSSPRVKRFVLDSLGVEPCFHAFPKGDWSRLLLLDGATLESIAKWLGAIVCADDLRRVTEGKAVRELKAALAGVYPESFGYTMYFKGIDFQRGDGAKVCGPQDVVSAGVSILVSLLGGLPTSLVSRLRFKLPKGLCDSASPRLDQETCGRALAKLLKLRFPEVYSLCCS